MPFGFGLGIVNTAQLADNAVTNAKLADNAVTDAEVAAAAAIAGTKLAAGWQKDTASGIAGLNAAAELTALDFMTQKYLSIALAMGA